MNFHVTDIVHSAQCTWASWAAWRDLPDQPAYRSCPTSQGLTQPLHLTHPTRPRRVGASQQVTAAGRDLQYGGPIHHPSLDCGPRRQVPCLAVRLCGTHGPAGRAAPGVWVPPRPPSKQSPVSGGGGRTRSPRADSRRHEPTLRAPRPGRPAPRARRTVAAEETRRSDRLLTGPDSGADRPLQRW